MGERHELGDGLIGKKSNLGFGWVACRKKSIAEEWVYRLKEEDGDKKRYKARLVVKGFAWKKGIDFDEIVSTIVKMTSIGTILSLVAVEYLHLE